MGLPIKLHVFDFDGTLFRSPEKPEDWSGGWWGRLESLSPPLVPEHPDADWWNGSVVSAAKSAIAKPDEMAVMVTGRIKKFSARVKDLLKQAGLTGFDEIYFSSGGPTDAYKIGVMKELIAKYPTIRGVAIWEDRSGHLSKFADWVEAGGRAAYPHLITVPAHPVEEPFSPERVASAYRVSARLFHVTSWRDLSDKNPGDRFTLKPGTQHAEGPGVYFSQDVPVKLTTAEGASQAGAVAVVETETPSASGWWRTKPALARKFDRPITWHTDGKSLSCEVKEVKQIPVTGAGTLPLLRSDCSFARVAARYKSKKKIETKDGDKAVVYEYGPRQVANRHKEKAERVEHLRKSISDLRAQIRKDLTAEDDLTRMSALAVALMDETAERVGNHESAEDGHFGVTGWQKKHLTFGNGKITIKYVGKSGVKHEKVVERAPTVKALKALCDGKSGDDCIFDVGGVQLNPEDVNEYLKKFDVTAKDIRGFRANDEMCKALRAERAKGPKELPRARKEKDEILKAEFKRALETVADIVGHEAATLKSQYLVPGLEDSYLHDGTVIKTLKVSTKTEGEKEDEAAEAMVKPLPKAKPPRQDLRKRRLETDDSDLDSTDDDLSLNYKRVASAWLVAARYLSAAGKVEQTDEGKWKGIRPDGSARYFPDKSQAEQYVSEEDGKAEADDESDRKKRHEEEKQWRDEDRKEKEEKERKEREAKVEKSRRDKLKKQMTNFKDSPLFSGDQSSLIGGSVDSLLASMTPEESAKYAEELVSARDAEFSAVARSGVIPDNNSSIKPKQIQKLKDKLDEQQLEYDSLKSAYEAEKDEGKKSELKKKMDDSAETVNDAKEKLAESFKSYYANASTRAAARNPASWIPNTTKALVGKDKQDRVNSTLGRYDSYTPDDRKAVFKQLKEMSEETVEEITKIEKLLRSSEGATDGPYRDSSKRQVLQEQLDALMAKNNYLSADINALTLHLVNDGDSEGGKMLSPVSSRLVKELSNQGWDLSEIANIGIGGDKLNREALMETIDSLDPSTMREMVEAAGGKDLIANYDRMAVKGNAKVMQKLYEDMASKLFDSIESDYFTEDSDDSDSDDSDGSGGYEPRRKPKEKSWFDIVKSKVKDYKPYIPLSPSKYKGYISNFSKKLKGLMSRKSKTSSLAVRVSDRYLSEYVGRAVR